MAHGTRVYLGHGKVHGGHGGEELWDAGLEGVLGVRDDQKMRLALGGHGVIPDIRPIPFIHPSIRTSIRTFVHPSVHPRHNKMMMMTIFKNAQRSVRVAVSDLCEDSGVAGDLCDACRFFRKTYE